MDLKDLKIDPEFKEKIPPLTEDEFSLLEQNILADGQVMVPLIIWNDTILDGHNRYRILQKHPDIPFKTFPKKFPDKYAAIAWICRNQLGRRNLTPEQKRYLIGKQYEADGRSTVKTIWMRRTTMDEMRIDEKEMEKQGSFDILPRLKRPFPAYAGVILAKTSRRGPLEAFPRV